jgi:hypothetical protein
MNLQLIERHLFIVDPSNGFSIRPQKLKTLPVRSDMKLDVDLEFRVSEKNFKNIAERAKDLVVLCRAGVEVRVCQFAQNQKAIVPPTDSYLSREESILGWDAPGLLHLNDWRIGKSSADSLAISNVKVGKSLVSYLDRFFLFIPSNARGHRVPSGEP